MELIFKEGNFTVKTLDTHEEMRAAFRLRHEVFCNELRWVPPSPDGLDKDDYDAFSRSIGIYDKSNEIIGHVRLITAPAPYMIEKEFACLLPKEKPFKKFMGMAESTRICIRKDARSNSHMSMTLAHLLYKAIYHWSLQNKIEHLITIVEKRYYLLLKRSNFPFEPLGNFLPLGEGVLSGVVRLEWREVESVLKHKRPAFLNWLINVSDPAQRQLQ